MIKLSFVLHIIWYLLLNGFEESQIFSVFLDFFDPAEHHPPCPGDRLTLSIEFEPCVCVFGWAEIGLKVI